MGEYRLTSECHLVTVPISGTARTVVYFPLRSLVLEVNECGAALVSRLKSAAVQTAEPGEIEFLDALQAIKVVNGSPDIVPEAPRPEQPRPTNVILLAASRCNLRCEYCYANADAEGSLLGMDIAEAAVATIVRNALETRANYIKVEFHGGGEPTINWDVLVGTVETARGRCAEHRLHLRTELCTNGVMPPEHARWVAQNIDDITVSIDGPAEIQNRQRPMADGGPSFERVAQTIRILSEYHKRFSFRTTVTAWSAAGLPGSYEFLCNEFRPALFCVEPLFLCGRCEKTGCERPPVGEFVAAICACIDESPRLGVPVVYSGGKLHSLETRFCGTAGHNFAVTPAGDVTSCVEVSSRGDPRSDIFMYGTYDRESRSFWLDRKRYQRLVSLRVQEFPSCVDCLARWHCAGDCLAKAPDMARIVDRRNDYRCAINRAVTIHQIGRQLRNVQTMAEAGARQPAEV